jgi:hypothetical protein
MKKATFFAVASIAAVGTVSSQGLYFLQDEVQESIPAKWTVGMNLVWDNNFNPTITSGPGFEEEAWSLNPYAAVTLTNVSPQTTLDLYARIGANYYLQDSELPGASDTTGNGRLGLDLTHRFSERLRFSSTNFLAYEMEPEYSYGLSTARSGNDPYTYWSSDNSVGYRWTDRVGSFTGINFTNYLGNGAVSDRSSWSIYHQMRYQFAPRTVLTGQYKYEQWTGDASDSTNHYITLGLEHRLNPTSVFLLDIGAQLREVDGGDSTTSPYFQAALNSQLNSRFSVRSFMRYGIEDYDTIRNVDSSSYEYNDQRTLRIGLSGDYALSPRLSLFGGLDYISTNFDKGLIVSGPGALTDEGATEDILNLYVGLRAKFGDNLTGECSINYTDSASDFLGNDYDRLRLSMGVNYSF